jgi:hypothetical protein
MRDLKEEYQPRIFADKRGYERDSANLVLYGSQSYC